MNVSDIYIGRGNSSVSVWSLGRKGNEPEGSEIRFEDLKTFSESGQNEEPHVAHRSIQQIIRHLYICRI